MSVASTRPESISETRSQRAASFMKVGRDENRHALVARQVDQQFPEPVACQRIDARCRLIEDEHFRLMHDGDGQRQPLANAERQIRCRAGRDVRQAELFDQARRGARSRLARRADGTAAHGDRDSAGPSVRYRARTIATCSRREGAPRCRGHRAACRTAAPRLRVGGSKPVSIFIVVVLPQPLEPTKPKISPRSMVKLTRSTAVKSPNRQVRSRATITGSASAKRRGGISSLLVAGAKLFRQQRDKCLLDGRAAGLRLEIGRRARPPGMPGVHRDEPVEALGLFHVGRRDHDAHAGRAASGSDRSIPRTAAATADRRRSSARRGSAGRDRGSASSTGRVSAACRRTASSPADRRRAQVRCCPGARRFAIRRSARDCPNSRAKNSMFSRTLRSG